MKHVTILTVFVTLLLEELCQNLALTRRSQLRALMRKINCDKGQFFSRSEPRRLWGKSCNLACKKYESCVIEPVLKILSVSAVSLN